MGSLYPTDFMELWLLHPHLNTPNPGLAIAFVLLLTSLTSPDFGTPGSQINPPWHLRGWEWAKVYPGETPVTQDEGFLLWAPGFCLLLHDPTWQTKLILYMQEHEEASALIRKCIWWRFTYREFQAVKCMNLTFSTWDLADLHLFASVLSWFFATGKTLWMAILNFPKNFKQKISYIHFGFTQQLSDQRYFITFGCINSYVNKSCLQFSHILTFPV